MNRDLLSWEIIFVCCIFVSANSAKNRRFFSILLQVSSVSLIKKGLGVSIKHFVERFRLVIVSDERISSINHENNFLLKRNIESWVIKMRDAKSIGHLSILAQLSKRRKSTRCCFIIILLTVV